MEFVINMEVSAEMLAEELGVEWKRTQESTAEAVESKARCAMLMLALRDKCGQDNNKFSLALIDHDITIGKDERAAMLKFAKLPEANRKRITEDMKRREVASFWRLLQDGGLSNMCEDPPISDAKPESATVEAESAPQPVEEVQKLQTDIRAGRRTLIFGRPRAEELTPLLGMSKMGSVLGKVHLAQGWEMVLECFDLGLLSPGGVEVMRPTGRLLFNIALPRSHAAADYLGAFDLSTPRGCKKASEELMPFLRTHCDALLAAPETFMRIKHSADMEARAAIVAKQAAESKERRMAVLQSRGEKEVIVCGVTVWPYEHDNVTAYTYEQLRQAWFMFLDVEGVAQAHLWSKDGRHSRAICHRHLANKLQKMGDELGEEAQRWLSGVAMAYATLADALQRGPDVKLPTSVPWHDIQIAQ